MASLAQLAAQVRAGGPAAAAQLSSVFNGNGTAASGGPAEAPAEPGDPDKPAPAALIASLEEVCLDCSHIANGNDQCTICFL